MGIFPFKSLSYVTERGGMGKERVEHSIDTPGILYIPLFFFCGVSLDGKEE
jgi:hypothetical protein